MQAKDIPLKWLQNLEKKEALPACLTWATSLTLSRTCVQKI